MKKTLLLAVTLLFASQIQAAEKPSRGDIEAMCAANPEKCEKFMERAEQIKADCEADPEACEQKNEDLREMLEKRRNGG